MSGSCFTKNEMAKSTCFTLSKIHGRRCDFAWLGASMGSMSI